MDVRAIKKFYKLFSLNYGSVLSGTNAHAVCEEYLMKPSSYDLPSAVFTLSANNPSSLAKMQTKLANHLSESDLSLGDVSFTLTCGRHSFDHRLSFVADNLDDLVLKLRNSTVPMQKRDDSKVTDKFCPSMFDFLVFGN